MHRGHGTLVAFAFKRNIEYSLGASAKSTI